MQAFSFLGSESIDRIITHLKILPKAVVSMQLPNSTRKDPDALV